jgi:hypothetical protein
VQINVAFGQSFNRNKMKILCLAFSKKFWCPYSNVSEERIMAKVSEKCFAKASRSNGNQKFKLN